MIQDVAITSAVPMEPIDSLLLTVVWITVSAVVLFGAFLAQEIQKDDWSAARALAVAASGAATAWIVSLLGDHLAPGEGAAAGVLSLLLSIVVATIVTKRLYAIGLTRALVNVVAVFVVSLIATVLVVMPAISAMIRKLL